jgi:hypothetical protein
VSGYATDVNSPVVPVQAAMTVGKLT